jgi:hypothetical protein
LPFALGIPSWPNAADWQDYFDLIMPIRPAEVFATLQRASFESNLPQQRSGSWKSEGHTCPDKQNSLKDRAAKGTFRGVRQPEWVSLAPCDISGLCRVHEEVLSKSVNTSASSFCSEMLHSTVLSINILSAQSKLDALQRSYCSIRYPTQLPRVEKIIPLSSQHFHNFIKGKMPERLFGK